MPFIPQRLSLVRQTADSLRAGIVNGHWRDWLPGERELAANLLVGRNTLRAALRELSAAGLVKAIQGSGHRIVRVTEPTLPREKPRSIGLLIPDGLHALRPNQTLWIDQLRSLLIKRGLDLQLYHQHRFPRAPYRHACWVLVLCNATLQRRFARDGIPCVIAGTPHPRVNLPSVDLDHRSLCRHAAGLLISRGHRRIVFLTRHPIYAGDRESEIGFTEGARLSRHADVFAEIARHDDSRDGVSRTLQRLLRSPRPPTALLVGDSHHFLTVGSFLARAGNPNLALLCRDDDPFLSHLVPEPARYTFSSASLASNLLKLILQDNHAIVPPAIRLHPRLIQGESLLTLVPS